MGVESYNVLLLSKTELDFFEVDSCLVSMKNMKALTEAQANRLADESHYEYRDGLHIIELEVYINQQRPLRSSISIRFALCSHPTVDPVYIKLVKEIACRFDLNIVLMKEPTHRPRNGKLQCNDSDIGLILKNSIEIERGFWQKDFGSEVAALTCSEAIKAFILPKCKKSTNHKAGQTYNKLFNLD